MLVGTVEFVRWTEPLHCYQDCRSPSVRSQPMSTDNTMSHVQRPASRPQCPSCGSEAVARVMWGMPDQEMIDLAQLEDIDFGGCCITPDAPDFRCRTCNTAWQDPEGAQP
jgi:hypothetical protein